MSGAPRAARVRELPALLANQVAAGEVIERPASVLKELLENSLDAGAGEIVVEIEEGGRRLIRVRDDGGGIEREDLGLALARHATSKIASVEDLSAILSMGFRGEALPSIAAVSRLKLVSQAAGAEQAWAVALDGAAGAPSTQPDSHPQGTTVEVRDLFFNTPARRRFLRTVKTEFGHLEECVRRLALARFDVGFTLRHDRRELWRTAAVDDAAGCRRRLTRLLGERFAVSARELRAAAEGLSLHGWLPSAAAEQTGPARQYLFVNGRPVRDPVLAHAVRQAYGERMPAGAQPSFVLALELDPHQVDVNVHPAKHEVRFREPRLVHDFVAQAVRRFADDQAQSHAGTDTDEVRAGAGAEDVAAGLTPRRGPASPRVTAAGVREQLAGYAALHPATVNDAATAPAATDSQRVIAGEFLVLLEDQRVVVHHLPALRALALRLALGEEAATAAAATRPVLVPPSVDVGESAARAVEEAAALCRSLGLDLRRLGATRVAPVEVPAVLAGADLEDITARLARSLDKGAARSPEQRRADLVDLLCTAAAESQRPPDASELRALVRLTGRGVDAGAGVALDATALRGLLHKARGRP